MQQVPNQNFKVIHNIPLTLNVIKPISLNIIKENFSKRIPSYEKKL